jgi:DNA-directed RNA polymerase subunit RPC12/RpoP
MVIRTGMVDMPKLVCPDCTRKVAMHELDTQTVAAGGEFTTTYRCPFCRTAFDDVAAML